MGSAAMDDRQHLMRAVTAALNAGASGSDLVELIIRTGWQPRTTPDPNSEYLDGRLDSGRRVPIEIRHAEFSRLR